MIVRAEGVSCPCQGELCASSLTGWKRVSWNRSRGKITGGVTGEPFVYQQSRFTMKAASILREGGESAAAGLLQGLIAHRSRALPSIQTK